MLSLFFMEASENSYWLNSSTGILALMVAIHDDGKIKEVTYAD